MANLGDFQVVGIVPEDLDMTVLQDFDNSGEARAWMNRYVQSEDAGGWDMIQVIDTRDECAEVVYRWERPEGWDEV